MQTFMSWIENRQDPAPMRNDSDLIRDMIVKAGPDGVRKKLLYRKMGLPVSLVNALLQAWLDLAKIELCRIGDDEVVRWVGGLG